MKILSGTSSIHIGHLPKEEEEWKPRKPILLQPQRNANNKARQEDISSFKPESLLLQGLLDLGVASPSVDQGKMITYHSCKMQDGTIVKEGMSLVYVDRENEYTIGLFMRGYLILINTDRYSLVVVEKGVTKPSATHLGCPIVEFKDEVDVVPLNKIIGYLPLVHHCKESHCNVREEQTTCRIEQEDKRVSKTCVKHKFHEGGKIYVVNVYSLKCLENVDFLNVNSCAKKL